MKIIPILALGALCLVARPAVAQSAAERSAVEQAARDYIEGFYEGDSTRFMRSVHPDVNKYGFWIPRGQSSYSGGGMTFAQFLASARESRAEGERAPANAPREVQILDLMDQTAAVKVTAIWGIDYLLLAKYDGRWMVRQVMWQTRPR